MIRLRRSTIIDAPVDDVWRLLRDFNGHDSWHPAIAESRIENGDAAMTRRARCAAFRLADGAFLREQLIALSDRDMSLTYCLLEAPLPLMGYVATMRLRPVTDGDRTLRRSGNRSSIRRRSRRRRCRGWWRRTSTRPASRR